jgi:hypothetical protein
MSIKNNIVYSYYQDYDFSKKLSNVNYNNWVLLIDTNRKVPRHFIVKVNEIKTKQIPSSNYNSWLLPLTYIPNTELSVNISVDEYGNINNITGIPNYSYYLITYNGKDCIYFYESGSSILASDNISYYNIRGQSGIPLNIKKIYLINNNVFNSNYKQLVKIYNKVYTVEDFNRKEVYPQNILSNYGVKSDLIGDMSYKSSYMDSVYDIKYSDEKAISLKGDNIFQVILLLQSKSDLTLIYNYPIFLFF